MHVPTFVFAILAALTLPAAGAQPGRVKVMTFNIRYATESDGENKWSNRQEMVADLIRREACDFVGVQEALHEQLLALRRRVPEYDFVGVGRDDGDTRGEYSAILFRGDRWKSDRRGTFWLSDTPEQPGSKSFGNGITRIVTWGRFLHKDTGAPLWVFNTHFDHQSQPSRVKSAALLARTIAEQALPAKERIVVTGDFNAGEDNPAVRYLKGETGDPPITFVDSFRVAHPEEREVGTYNGFQGTSAGAKIDYIFVQPDVRIVRAAILRDHRDGRYPSDHFPVVAEVDFAP
jgi:endonuclease/exonuclease/phosphatase family metal-dependent hydrolase